MYFRQYLYMHRIKALKRVTDFWFDSLDRDFEKTPQSEDFLDTRFFAYKNLNLKQNQFLIIKIVCAKGPAPCKD